MEEKIRLFHGSRTGIQGKIVPKSRAECDFGSGFYMGTNINQPLTLVYNSKNPWLYTVEVDLKGLKILELERDLDWALVIAYNRGKLKSFEGTPIVNYVKKLITGYDLIKGVIADDRMFIVLDRFFNGDITDQALIHCLSDLDLGIQFTAVTQKACNQIRIIDSRKIDEDEKRNLKELSEENRRAGIELVDTVSRKYRREGKYFDEIVEEINGSEIG